MAHSGSSVYNDFNDRYHKALGETNELSESMLSIQQQVSALDARRLTIFEELAKLHWDEVASNAATSALSSTHNMAATALSVAESNITGLRNRATEAQAEMISSTQKLDKLSKENDEIQDQLNTLKNQLTANVKISSEYVEISNRIVSLQTKSRSASKKLKEADEERKKKEQAYLNDPYFSYLHDRHYGSDHYYAVGPIRWLDNWVASVCNYKAASENFDLLQSLQAFLNEKFSSYSAKEVNLKQERVNLVDSATNTPEVRKLERDATSKQYEVSSVERKLEKLNKEYSVVHNELAEYAHGRDRQTTLARKQMADMLQSTHIEELERLARNTPNSEDDDLVDELHEIINKIADNENGLRELSKAYDTAKKESDRLGNLVHDFSKKHYNRSSSKFKSSFDTEAFLLGYLAGDFDTSDLKKYHQSAPSYGGSYGGGSYGNSSFGSGSYNDDDTFDTGGGISISDAFETGGIIDSISDVFETGGDF